MIPVFIISNRGYAGKTLLAIGLGLKLIEKGYKVGYMKPISKTPVKQGGEVYDADALFIKEALSLSDPMNSISPFVLSYEMQSLLFEGKSVDAKRRIREALSAHKNKDFLLIGGAGDLFEGATLDSNALTLIEETGGKALMVEAWRGDLSMDTLLGGKRLLQGKFAGGVINKVPANALRHVEQNVKPFLGGKEVNIFGIFQKDSLLESITIAQLIEILHGRVLCCEDKLNEFVERFSIGAMDVDNALAYFRRVPNKAVITGAHRSDIQLVAMETSTKCIILTGGLSINDVVLGKAQSKGIPLISVPEDTFTTVDRIESVMGKTRIREQRKIDRAKEIIDTSFDTDGFLQGLS
ncbi:MAG: phosphotransacetylase family protein [Alphaproteobacteria bacterium]|uniref:Phosphotransacetylase family protein n=1 Tax=Candidatus Nitrobium versatile TaxID=2884831 RepID=A0A953SI16_9BACT|nr:phosphotransacetylase family protein [Candidatus Nitrobium versatile]